MRNLMMNSFLCACLALGLVACGDDDTSSDSGENNNMNAGQGVDPGVAACQAHIACMNACETDECEQACTANAEPEALTRYNAVLTCVVTNMCVTGGDLDEACLRANCSDETLACFGSFPSSMGSMGGNNGGGDTGNPGGPEGCYSGPPDHMCDCSVSEAACSESGGIWTPQCTCNGGNNGGNPGGNPGGDNGGNDAAAMAACQNLISCLNACDETDMACQQQCVNSASPEGQRRFQAAAQCFQDNMCEDQQCAQANCAAEMAACGLGGAGGGGTPGGMTGTGGCASMFMCAQANCNPSDQACLQGCFNQLDQEGQQLFLAYNNCVASNMCQDQACAEQNCGAELQACFAD